MTWSERTTLARATQGMAPHPRDARFGYHGPQTAKTKPRPRIPANSARCQLLAMGDDLIEPSRIPPERIRLGVGQHRIARFLKKSRIEKNAGGNKLAIITNLSVDVENRSPAIRTRDA